nr:hypothetical protein [uncultured Methanomethylovorans sp.]
MIIKCLSRLLNSIDKVILEKETIYKLMTHVKEMMGFIPHVDKPLFAYPSNKFY